MCTTDIYHNTFTHNLENFKPGLRIIFSPCSPLLVIKLEVNWMTVMVTSSALAGADSGNISTDNCGTITPNYVFELINNMKNGKSAGLDQLNIKLLNFAAPFISKSLVHIWDISIMNSTFPGRSKGHTNRKSGDRSDLASTDISILLNISFS